VDLWQGGYLVSACHGRDFFYRGRGTNGGACDRKHTPCDNSSQLGERLWEDYQAFAQRDLGEYEITYLFVDGIAERLRPDGKREPVLAAWGFTIEGRRVLLHMMAGSKEDADIIILASFNMVNVPCGSWVASSRCKMVPR
jgi:hypothetical protein